MPFPLLLALGLFSMGAAAANSGDDDSSSDASDDSSMGCSSDSSSSDSSDSYSGWSGSSFDPLGGSMSSSRFNQEEDHYRHVGGSMLMEQMERQRQVDHNNKWTPAVLRGDLPPSILY